jgi:hypothetical protein
LWSGEQFDLGERKSGKFWETYMDDDAAAAIWTGKENIRGFGSHDLVFFEIHIVGEERS